MLLYTCTHFTIFADPLSCLQSLHSMNNDIDHPYIFDIFYSYCVSNQGKIVNFCCIPSHIGIHGNNEADKAAKSALDFEIMKFRTPYTYFKLYELSLADILRLL